MESNQKCSKTFDMVTKIFPEEEILEFWEYEPDEPNDYFSVDYSFPGPFCHSHFVKEICGDPDCWCMIDIAENNNECFNCVQK